MTVTRHIEATASRRLLGPLVSLVGRASGFEQQASHRIKALDEELHKFPADLEIGSAEAMGQKTGLITSWGGGAFGFMRSLAVIGPLTVPQIAQMRPTSRQRMQRLSDELAAEGLVEFIDNPRHRRSKLVRLTRKGDARYRELNARFLAIASAMGDELSEADIRETAEIVRRLSDEAKGALEAAGAEHEAG